MDCESLSMKIKAMMTSESFLRISFPHLDAFGHGITAATAELRYSVSTPPSLTVEINNSLLDKYAAPTQRVETLALVLYRRTGRLT